MQAICIQALESLDSDFQSRSGGGESGSRDGGWMRCPFCEERRREGREQERARERKRERKRAKARLVEVSSPRIVPAIIYFLSDRGDRLYGGCSVQAPGSDDGVPGSAFVTAARSMSAVCFAYREVHSMKISRESQKRRRRK